ncbi:MAG: FHA domain-containing protein [Planctomycetota bacterium]|jgi:hypothetical protein
MPTLRVVKGRSTAEEFRFEESVTLGRAVDSDVRVFDEAASRHHVVIQLEAGAWGAIDNRSVNGLFVNGRRVERQKLRTGDEIAVRNLTLLFLDDGATDRPTVVSDKALRIESRIEPKESRVGGREEELLGRLAALYRFHGILGESRHRLNELIPKHLEEIFAPARAALVLPDGDRGIYSRSVIDHVRTEQEAILVREPEADLPQAASLVREKPRWCARRSFPRWPRRSARSVRSTWTASAASRFPATIWSCSVRWRARRRRRFDRRPPVRNGPANLIACSASPRRCARWARRSHESPRPTPRF